MDDLISRQSAIDALNGCTEIYLNNLPPTISKKNAVDAVKALPSAQPNLQPTCNQLATDCISRQAAVDAVHSAIYPYFCGAEDGDALSDEEKLVLSVNKTICTAIKALPSAEQRGKWLEHKDYPRLAYLCSECNWFTTDRSFYCPHCGARMDGERDE